MSCAHPLARHDPAVVGVELVTVRALERDRHAVQQQLPALDLDLAEADPLRDDLLHVPGPVAVLEHQRVEVRRLGRPQPGRAHRPRRLQHCLAAGPDRAGRRQSRPEDLGSVRGHHRRDHVMTRRQRSGAVLERRAKLDRRVAVGGVEVGADHEVPQAHLRLGDQVHVAEDPGEPPVVLVLQVAAVGVVDHLDREHVGPGPQVLGHVELAWREGVLAVAEPLPVQPHVVGRLHAREVHDDAPALPLGRHLEVRAVEPRGVVVVGHARRVGLEGMLDVREERPIVRPVLVRAYHLPVRRHRQRVPAGVVVARLLEPRRHREGVLRPAETPVSVQESEVRRTRPVAAERRLAGRVRDEPGARPLGAHGEDGRVFPLGLTRRVLRRGEEEEGGKQAGDHGFLLEGVTGGGDSRLPCGAGRPAAPTSGEPAALVTDRPRSRNQTVAS